MNRSILSVAVFLAAAVPAWAQAKQDKVVKRDRTVVEGKITQDKYSGVVVGGTTIPAEQVARVEYADCPASFLSAFSAMDEGKWEDAISGLKSAYDRVTTGPEKERLKVGKWFEPYYLFYLAYCERNLSRYDDALRRLAAYRETKDGTPKEPSRMWADAFELSLECLRERGKPEDLDEMTKLIASIDTSAPKDPKEFRDGLKKRARKQQAELLFDKKEYAKAKETFEQLVGDPDPAIKADANAGIIKCLEEMKKPAELKAFCDRILSVDTNPLGLRLLASNALARSLRDDAKDLRGALRQYVDSVVKYNPGRGSGYERDHEEAIFQLADSYRKLAGVAKEVSGKKFYLGAAASAFREAALTYPSGRRRDEALKLADQADQEAAKLKTP